MKLTKNGIETTAGPAEWFTGAVYVDSVAAPSDPSRLGASSVHFTPGARTAWHTHPQRPDHLRHRGRRPGSRRGGPIEVIRSGDRVFFEPGEDHWHGAAPNRFMTHLAISMSTRATVMYGTRDVGIMNPCDPVSSVSSNFT